MVDVVESFFDWLGQEFPHVIHQFEPAFDLGEELDGSRFCFGGEDQGYFRAFVDDGRNVGLNAL